MNIGGLERIMRHYRILTAGEPDELAAAVETAINDGWELTGLMTEYIEQEYGKQTFAQAIIKTSADRPSRWASCRTPGCNEPIVRDNFCLLHFREVCPATTNEPEEIK